MSESYVTLRSDDTSWLIASMDASGDLVITGEDTESLGQKGLNYEYIITVKEVDVPD